MSEKKIDFSKFTPDELLLLDNQICFPLYATAKEIVNVYRPYLDAIDLTYTQYLVMMVLWEVKEISVRELGHRLSLDSGTLTPLLKKLENKGLLGRTRSHEDERVVNITISDKGLALKDKAWMVPVHMQEHLKGFSLEDFRELRTLLKKLHKSVEETKEARKRIKR